MKNWVMAIVLGCTILSTSLVPYTNKTIFIPHSPTQDLTLQEPLIRYRRNHLRINENFDFVNSLFFQGSINPRKIRKYYLINGQDSLQVKDADVTGYKDISADWLNINSVDPSDQSLFQSTFSITPRSRRFGIMMNAHYQISHFPIWWVELLVPFIQAETELRLKETNIKNEIPVPNGEALDVFSNAKDALTNPFWKYGKFKHGINRIAGFGDIALKVGTTTIKEDTLQHNFYGVFIIPTAPHQKNEYIFEPVLGNGGHVGIGAGNHLDFSFYIKRRHAFDLLSTLEYLYLLKTTQLRTFDLISNGPWSRYLETVSLDKPDTVTGGVNSFTKRMNVCPGSSFSLLSSFHYNYKISRRNSFNLECGHNLWYREQEKVSLKDAWDENVGIASLSAGDLADTTHSKTQPTATIATNKVVGTTPPTFTTVPETDLNLNSAKHPTTISNTVFLALGVNGEHKGFCYSCNGGVSFEQGGNNSALDQWSTWISLKITL